MSSPALSKTYDLLVWLEPQLAKFPKEQRFRLAARIEESLLRFYDLILHASRTRNQLSLLQEADLELERLRMLIRAAQDIKAISFKQYQAASEKINEVGRILGSWLSKHRSATPAGNPADCGEESTAGRLLEQQS